MSILVRILFHPWHYGPRRDRFNEWLFMHAPRSFRVAVMTLGAKRNGKL